MERRVLAVVVDEEGGVDLQTDEFTILEALGIAGIVSRWADELAAAEEEAEEL